MVDRAMVNQAAAGMRNDPTLYDPDFDGSELSSLGQWKLYLVVNAAAATTPLTVYIASANDEALWDARRESVETFLADTGASAGGFEIKAGAAPASGPAESGLRGLEEMRQGGAGAGAALPVPPIGGGGAAK